MQIMAAVSWRLTPPTTQIWVHWCVTLHPCIHACSHPPTTLAWLPSCPPSAPPSLCLTCLAARWLAAARYLLRLSVCLSGPELRRVSELVDLSLMDITALHFRPSLLAAAALHLTLPQQHHARLAQLSVRAGMRIKQLPLLRR